MVFLSNGARSGLITGYLGLLFLLLLGSAWPGYAATALAPTASVAPTTQVGPRFATVWRIRGEVSAQGRSSHVERPLHPGDPVYVGERLRAASLAEAVLKTEDAGVLAIRPNTEFVVDRFIAQGTPDDSFVLRLVKGSLRVISGWTARSNQAGHQVVTATATIGIRGTDHEPYVLSAALAGDSLNQEGTYDKVNRGATTLQVGAQGLAIEAGRVGFARATPKNAKNTTKRGLMTLLMPVLLQKVPDFYVPGAFEDELDRLSAATEENAMQQLEVLRQSRPTATGAKMSSGGVDECSATEVAKTWLRKFDAAIIRHHAPAILALFGPEVVVHVTVRQPTGDSATVDFSRQEFANSTLTALQGLTDYQQRRPSIAGYPAQPGVCDRINVKSLVIEQGQQNGQPYRFESLEEYLLEHRAGHWLAIQASSTQQ